VHAHAILGSAVFCKFLLNTLYLWPANKTGRLDDSLAHLQQLGFQLPVEGHQIYKRDFGILRHSLTFDGVVMERRIFAGLPATIVFAGTSRVTTLPAPTIAFSPMITFERIVAPEPIDAPRLTSVVSTFQSLSVWSSPPGAVARGYESLTKVTPWPTNTLSSMVTPSQTNV